MVNIIKTSFKFNFTIAMVVIMIMKCFIKNLCFIMNLYFIMHLVQ